MPPKRKATKPGDGKRYPLNMRTTKKLRDLLEHAADESGRSLAQEVEYRLERSLDREAIVVEALGGDNSGLIGELVKILGWQDSSDERVEDTYYLAAITLLLVYADRDLGQLSKAAIFDLWITASATRIANCTNLDYGEAWERADKLFPEVQNNLSMFQHLNQRLRGSRKASAKGRKKIKT